MRHKKAVGLTAAALSIVLAAKAGDLYEEKKRGRRKQKWRAKLKSTLHVGRSRR